MYGRRPALDRASLWQTATKGPHLLWCSSSRRPHRRHSRRRRPRRRHRPHAVARSAPRPHAAVADERQIQAVRDRGEGEGTWPPPPRRYGFKHSVPLYIACLFLCACSCAAKAISSWVLVRMAASVHVLGEWTVALVLWFN
eukprot:scaffold75025_cov51-Phaeocystis_antarctica.AAC.1